MWGLKPEELDALWDPKKSGTHTDSLVVQATLYQVVKELLKHQRVTEASGMLFYIPIEDWLELKREAGL